LHHTQGHTTHRADDPEQCHIPFGAMERMKSFEQFSAYKTPEIVWCAFFDRDLHFEDAIGFSHACLLEALACVWPMALLLSSVHSPYQLAL
jgi:hypothetical protein